MGSKCFWSTALLPWAERWRSPLLWSSRQDFGRRSFPPPSVLCGRKTPANLTFKNLDDHECGATTPSEVMKFITSILKITSSSLTAGPRRWWLPGPPENDRPTSKQEDVYHSDTKQMLVQRLEVLPEPHGSRAPSVGGTQTCAVRGRGGLTQNDSLKWSECNL